MTGPRPEEPTEQPTEEPTGSVGEEAVKLFAALSDSLGQWAGESPGGLAAQLDEHLATGAPECRWCPVCRTIHAFRSAGPEVRVQLTAAAANLMQAAAGLLAAAAEPPPGSTSGGAASAGSTSSGATRPTRPGPVQHIDLDDEGAHDR